MDAEAKKVKLATERAVNKIDIDKNEKRECTIFKEFFTIYASRYQGAMVDTLKLRWRFHLRDKHIDC